MGIGHIFVKAYMKYIPTEKRIANVSVSGSIRHLCAKCLTEVLGEYGLVVFLLHARESSVEYDLSLDWQVLHHL